MPSEEQAGTRAAIRFQRGKPFLNITGNRAGYAHLAEIFAQLSRAEAGTHSRDTKEATEAASRAAEVIVRGAGQMLGEVIVDETLSHEAGIPSKKTLWWTLAQTSVVPAGHHDRRAVPPAPRRGLVDRTVDADDESGAYAFTD